MRLTNPPPTPPSGRILMWRLLDGEGKERYFGALADGTVFQRLPGSGWKTLVGGPTDPESSFDLVMGMTELAESQGARLAGGPVEFGMDERVLDAIRAGTGWHSNDAMLRIGFDMAARTAR